MGRTDVIVSRFVPFMCAAATFSRSFTWFLPLHTLLFCGSVYARARLPLPHCTPAAPVPHAPRCRRKQAEKTLGLCYLLYARIPRYYAHAYAHSLAPHRFTPRAARRATLPLVLPAARVTFPPALCLPILPCLPSLLALFTTPGRVVGHGRATLLPVRCRCPLLRRLPYAPRRFCCTFARARCTLWFLLGYSKNRTRWDRTYLLYAYLPPAVPFPHYDSDLDTFTPHTFSPTPKPHMNGLGLVGWLVVGVSFTLTFYTFPTHFFPPTLPTPTPTPSHPWRGSALRCGSA